MTARDSTTKKPRCGFADVPRRGAIALAALTALGAVSTARAGLTGTLYPALGFDVVMGSQGYLELSGFLAPTVPYAGPDAELGGSASGRRVGIGAAQFYVGGSSSGAYLGYRGLAVTPAGSYPLGTLGTNSVPDLGAVGLGTSTTQAVADSGVIVGTSELWADDGTRDLGTRAVWWGAGETTPHALAMPPHFTDTQGVGWAGTSTSSAGGVIVGWGTPYKGDVSEGNRALRWMTPTSAPDVLQRLPGMSEWGGNRSSAAAVNDAGTAVGQGPTYDSAGTLIGTSALRWQAGGTAVTPLGHLGSAADGTYRSSANAVDKLGNTVGMSFKYDAAHNPLGVAAVRWPADSAKPVELGGLGIGSDRQAWTYAVGINDSGTVFGVGQQFTPAGDSQGWRAIRWLPGDTAPHALKPLSMGLSGSTYEYAYAMNRKGWIAGTANAVLTSSSEPSDPMHLDVHAVVWDPHGGIHDLNKLLPAGSPWKLYGAYAISDGGLVTGIGYYGLESNGQVYYDARMFSMQLSTSGTDE
jgi:hypothetical protein